MTVQEAYEWDLDEAADQVFGHTGRASSPRV